MRRNIKKARLWIGNPHLYQEPTVNDYFVVEDELTRGIAIYQRQYPGDLAPYIGEVPTAVFDHCTYYRLAKSKDFREELELEWAEFQYKVEWCHPYRALFSSDIATFTKGADSWFLSEDFTILTRDPNNTGDDENDIIYDIPDLPYPKNEPDGLSDITPTHILTDLAFNTYVTAYVESNTSNQDPTESELETLRNEWESALEESGGNVVLIGLILGSSPQLIAEDKALLSDQLIIDAVSPHINDLILVAQTVGLKNNENVIVNGELNSPIPNTDIDSINDNFFRALSSMCNPSELEKNGNLAMIYKYASFFNSLKKNGKACLDIASLNSSMYYKSVPIHSIEIITHPILGMKMLIVTYITNPNLQTTLFCNPVYNDKQYGLKVTDGDVSYLLPLSLVAYYSDNFDLYDVLPGYFIHDITGLFTMVELTNNTTYTKITEASGNEGFWDDEVDSGGGIKKGGGVTKASGDNRLLLSVISTIVNVRLRLTKEYSITDYMDALFYSLFTECNIGYAQELMIASPYNTPDIFRCMGALVSAITQNPYSEKVYTWLELLLYGSNFVFKYTPSRDTDSFNPIANIAGMFDSGRQSTIEDAWYGFRWPENKMPNMTFEYHAGKLFGFKKLAAANWINTIEIDLNDMDFSSTPFVVGDFVFPKSALNYMRAFRLKWVGEGYTSPKSLQTIAYPGNIDLTNMDDVSAFNTYFGPVYIENMFETAVISNALNTVVLANSVNESEDNPHWLSSTFKLPRYVDVLLLQDFSMHKLDLKNLIVDGLHKSLIMNSVFTDNIVLPEGEYLFRLNGCITDVLDMSKAKVYKYFKDRDFDETGISNFIYTGEKDEFTVSVTDNWYIDNLRNNVAKQAVYLPSMTDSLAQLRSGTFWVIQGIVGPIRVLQDGITELDYSGMMKARNCHYNFITPLMYPSLKTVNFGNTSKLISFYVPCNYTGSLESYIEDITGNFTIFGGSSLTTADFSNMPHLSSSTIDLLINSITEYSNIHTVIFNTVLQNKITSAQIAAATAKGITILYDPYATYDPNA